MSGDLLTLVSDLWKTQLEQLEDAKAAAGGFSSSGSTSDLLEVMGHLNKKKDGSPEKHPMVF